MYPFFESITSAKDLWYYKGQNIPVVREGNTFRADRNGIEYTCTLTEEGEVTLRRDQIRNTTNATVSLVPMQARFRFPGGEFEVYTQYNINFRESTGQWQPLMTKVETFCASMRSANGATPFLALWDQQGQRGMAYHLLVDSAWEMAAFRKPIGEAFAAVDVVAGFHDAPVLTLEPGETVQLPTILFYDFRNKLDMDAWKLHRWFHAYHPRKQPPILYNTWLYKFDNFTPEDIMSQIPVAAELGVEYFTVDAGWFGEKGNWYESLGDWEESENSALEGKLSQVSQLVRDAGMKFGLWLEVERAGLSSKITKEHPEYFVPGITNAKYALLNFAVPEARKYLLDTIDGLIEKYNIEFIKFDFNADQDHIDGDPAYINYYKGYRLFADELAKRHPDLYMGSCASGGHRMDINNALQFGSFWLSDNQGVVLTMRIFKDTIKRLCPQAIERWLTIHDYPGFPSASSKPKSMFLGELDYSWTSAIGVNDDWVDSFMAGGPLGLTCDLTNFGPELKERIKKNIASIKENREFWRTCECRILGDTQRLWALQYNDPAFDRVEVTAFLLSVEQKFVTVYPVVDTDADYLLDGKVCSGKDINRFGVQLPFKVSMSAQRICLTKVK